MKKIYSCLVSIFEKALFFILLVFSFYASAQQEGSIWYFGTNAGLDFNTIPPTPLTNGQINTLEGSASIADANGQLLFYTDGSKAYDRNHNLMPNGTSGLGGHSSSSQSAVVVPFPGNSEKYFLFTVSAYINSNLVYSIIDMSLNNGLGDIQADAKAIPVLNATGEYIQATLSGDGTFWWVLTHKSGSADYYAFKVTSAGVDMANPVISTTGAATTAQGDIGFLKFNNIGTKIVRTSYISNHFNISDFDNTTGIVSNTMHVPLFAAYGAEFSPNSRFLYISAYSSMGVKQYDLQAGVTESQLVASVHSYSNLATGALQAAPDGKIYSSRYGAGALDVIHEPNLAGNSANFQLNGQSLGGATTQLGLTNIISSLVSQGPPVISGLTSSEVTSDGAVLEAFVSSDGGAAISQRGFYFGTSPNPSENETFVTGTTGTMSLQVSNLQENTLYYFSAFATNLNGTTHLSNATFTTPEGLDTEPPTAMCVEGIVIQLDELGYAAITAEMIDNGSTDNEGIAEYALDIYEFNCSDIGENTVLLTVTDTSGNTASCIAIVTVEDSYAPKISEVQDHTIDLAEALNYFIVPDYFTEGFVTVYDNCTPVVSNLTQTPEPGTLLGEGAYTISLSATDDYGNSATRMFELTIDGTLSINKPAEMMDLSLYPNPAHNSFNILNPDNLVIDKVTIYDLQGRLVHSLEVVKNNALPQIDVNHLASAIYAVLIQGEGRQTVKQLIVR